MVVEWAFIAVICLVSAVSTALWLTPKRHVAKKPMLEPSGDEVYLFDGDTMIETSGAAEGREPSNWAELKALFVGRFPDFPASPEAVREQGNIRLSSVDCSIHQGVLCEWIDGITRVELRHDATAVDPAQVQDPVRAATDNAPYPIWCADQDGNVCWHNEAYTRLKRKVRNTSKADSDALFDLSDPMGPSGHRKRVSVTADDGNQQLWFDLTIIDQGENKLCYATDINAVVDAEIAQRNFVQTLAKTFAQLSIGLAIFDRNRQLALFNPALIDLTSLPADFLSGRPSVMTFFDRLRNQNMMPEPKNYGGWRQQMTDLIEAATDGRYQETWSLPSGSVYSVSGRPHPDGAVAFLLEDITAEITLTRRFRSEIELGQSILDQLGDAIAVFSSDGMLAFSNTAYHQLWDVDPEASFAMVSVLDATRVWQDNCTATPVWGEIRDFVDNRENRSDWQETVHLRSGAALTCTVSPIQNGATMIRFAKKTANEKITALTNSSG